MRWALALVIWAGCYAPQPPAGAPCPDGVCPTGLTCSPATMTCETHPVDAASGDAPVTMIDARLLDARMIDSPPPPNVPMLRQQSVNGADLAATVSTTLPNVPISGHVLVMIGATPSGSLTSVTGGGVNWVKAVESTVLDNIEIWYGVTDGSNATVTINRTSSSSPIWLSVTEWSGLATSGSLIDTAGASGMTSPADPGTVTTTGPALLVFGVTDDAGNTFGTPSPSSWTSLTTATTSSVVQGAWYRVEPASGTYDVSVSETQNSWEAALVAFAYTP